MTGAARASPDGSNAVKRTLAWPLCASLDTSMLRLCGVGIARHVQKNSAKDHGINRRLVPPVTDAPTILNPYHTAMSRNVHPGLPRVIRLALLLMVLSPLSLAVPKLISSEPEN